MMLQVESGWPVAAIQDSCLQAALVLALAPWQSQRIASPIPKIPSLWPLS